MLYFLIIALIFAVNKDAGLVTLFLISIYFGWWLYLMIAFILIVVWIVREIFKIIFERVD